MESTYCMYSSGTDQSNTLGSETWSLSCPELNVYPLTDESECMGFRETVAKAHSVMAIGLTMLKDQLGSSHKPRLVYVVPHDVASQFNS